MVNIDEIWYGAELVKRGFSRMLNGGVIMDVTNAEQARIAEEAGAIAVMALERVPADIRAAGGVARMADPKKIKEIMDAVSIPVMAKVRIGHVTEALALEALGIDMIDESEVLTPADPFFHIYKKKFSVPFVCGARDLGEAVRRIWEGAAMIRTKGEAGTGNVIEAVRHMHLMNRAILEVKNADDECLLKMAEHYAESYVKLLRNVRELEGLTPTITKCDIVYEDFTLEEIIKGIYDILKEIKKRGRLPVVNYAAGGIATPADAALMMKMGADGVFVGSGIFKSPNPIEMARAIVEATMNYDKPEKIAEVCEGLSGMTGRDIASLEVKLQERGW